MSSPTSSPFADVIQSLAGLHQEHHQALLDMREDQERRFCALVQNQQQDRELFRSWMDREVRAGGIPPAPALPTHMPLQKMGPQDDPEAFLDLFEKTAEACGCPRWTGQCASFHCCPGRRSWRRSSCQFRTSWSTTTWSEPSSSGSAGTPSNIASASDRWSWGKTAGPSWWLISSGTRAADGCWPAKATSTRSSTVWCWNSSLRGCPRRPRSGSSATARRRWTWPSNSRRTRWRRATELVNPPASPKAPLRPLPLMQVPFERIGMDLIGPLERSARGHRFALVLVDYATRYPEAVALRNISAKSVAEALFSMISLVGIPKEILTDQGVYVTNHSRTLWIVGN